jgi:hypothetical protein
VPCPFPTPPRSVYSSPHHPAAAPPRLAGGSHTILIILCIRTTGVVCVVCVVWLLLGWWWLVQLLMGLLRAVESAGPGCESLVSAFPFLVPTATASLRHRFLSRVMRRERTRNLLLTAPGVVVAGGWWCAGWGTGCAAEVRFHAGREPTGRGPLQVALLLHRVLPAAPPAHRNNTTTTPPPQPPPPPP